MTRNNQLESSRYLLDVMRTISELVEDENTKFVFEQLVEHIEKQGTLPTDKKHLSRVIGL